MTTSDTILASLDAGVLRLVLNRPDKLNSFNEDMHMALRAQIQRAHDDADVRAVLLTGAGRGFCAGQDLGDRDPRKGGPAPDLGKTLETFYNPTLRLIRQLEKPVICGFSDGGIVALLAAIRAPELPGALIACGANTTPAGLKWPVRLGMALRYLVCREPRTKMMLCQPQISPAMLGRIQVPTLVLCGAHDMIRPADSRAIAAAIPGARLQELPHEGHGTYIVHSPKLAHLVLAFLRTL